MFIKAVLVSTDQNSFINHRDSYVEIISISELYSFVKNNKSNLIIKDNIKKLVHEILRCQSLKFNIDPFKAVSFDKQERLDKKIPNSALYL